MSSPNVWEAGTVAADDGVSLHVEATGPAGVALNVVFLHGWCLSAQMWRHQLRDLTGNPEAPVRLVAFDHRGHGRSSPVPGVPVPLTRLADDLLAVLDQAVGADPIVLVGHSLGGLTVSAFAQRHPGAFAQRVRGAVFVNAAPGLLADGGFGVPRPLARLAHGVVPAQLARRVRDCERSGDAATPRGLAVQRAFLRWLLFGARVHPADVALAVNTMLQTSVPSCAALDALDDAARDVLIRTLSAVPVRVVAGGRDKLIPVAHSRVIAERVGGAQMSVLAGAGHLVPLERPSALTATVNEVIGLAAGVRAAETPRRAAVARHRLQPA